MLAGCSSALLTQRHRLRSDDAAAAPLIQACHFQLQDKMSAQQFNLPCSFSRKESARVSLSLEKPADTRSTCSFRQSSIAPTSASLVAQTASWESRREVEGDEGFWDRGGKSLKRCYDRSSSEDSTCFDRSKRKRTLGSEAWLVYGGGAGGAGGGEEFWFPRSINEPSFVGEEKVCFVPNATNALLGALGMEMVGEMEVGTSGAGALGRSNPDSSSSSDTHGSSPKPNDDSSENESGNGARISNPSGGVAEAATAAENNQTEQQSFELVSLITDCVEAISGSNHTAINYYLARLGELATPTGSPVHRLVAYFTEALALRAAKLWPHIFFIAPPREIADQLVDDEDDATAFRLLNHVSPIPKFLHFTLNERLLRVFEGKDRVHIIDFDIKQGLQWPGLFQSLASRPNPPSHVRITGIGESKQDLQDTGARLAGFAEALHLPFEFHPVVDRLEDVRLWMLHVKEREFVAVNCVLQLHKALYDENRAALMDLLGLIRSTNPAVLLVGEQEADHNGQRWETRFANSFKYYAAIFDSLDLSLPVDSPARIKIEEMFARKIRNIVACEGSERVERHETFTKWRRYLEDGGYRCIGFGQRETLQSRMLLRMYSSENYSIEKEDAGDDGDAAGLTLKWLDQPLYTVSAWAPLDIAGSSSTSQPG
ncbi:SCL28-like protein [Dioscorea alata]|uniref:SCL28-like protein n=1 Tax=Dioscorea alata TaxID=55571 RepID=A0ACB7WGL4_DIOAL|nr:SCL28-like protein [Dioscorea alata]